MKKKSIQILLIESDEAYAALVTQVFSYDTDRFTLMSVGNLEEARIQLEKSPPDLVIIDLDLLTEEALTSLGAGWLMHRFPVVVMINRGSELLTAEAIKAGVLDYVLKSAKTLADLPHIVEHALREWNHITERRWTEKALQESENRYQQLLGSVMEGISLVDEKERIVYYNSAFTDILDLDCGDDLIDRSLLDCLPECRPGSTLAKSGSGKKGPSYRYELEITTARGKKKTILVSVSPCFDEEHNYRGAFNAVIDVTEIRRLQELAVRAERLETAGRVAAQVAHDFNNLLTPLIAYPDMLRSQLADDHTALKCLDDMERAASQMAEINDQLLTLGRRGHYELEPLNLNDIVNQVLDRISPIPADLTIEKSFAADLMNISGGGAQLLRVISNLVNNARDAMDDRGKLTIRTENFYVVGITKSLERIPRDEYVKVTVSDTGSGIPADVLPKIFDPYFTTKRCGDKRGSGLGLCVVHAVMEDHNGYLDVGSIPGKGTSFYLYFPISREQVKVAVDIGMVGGDESILVVDDDETQRQIIKHLLENLGYETVTVKNGQEAIAYLRRRRPDLLIVDLVMPGMDGTEVYQQALKINPMQKAVIISGYSQNDRITQALQSGVDAFVKKPLTLKSLSRPVREVLDGSRQDTVPV
ncbi:MAG: response regulator [candidate division Zixibacteria bacterium]|nr:response regulator [candidate division Zixibacteria bacterium]